MGSCAQLFAHSWSEFCMAICLLFWRHTYISASPEPLECAGSIPIVTSTELRRITLPSSVMHISFLCTQRCGICIKNQSVFSGWISYWISQEIDATTIHIKSSIISIASSWLWQYSLAQFCQSRSGSGSDLDSSVVLHKCTVVGWQGCITTWNFAFLSFWNARFNLKVKKWHSFQEWTCFWRI